MTGIAAIDDSGREVDFHLLHVTSVSLLVSGGFDVKLAQRWLATFDFNLHVNRHFGSAFC